ncbi:hypothetical protein GGI07_005200 [Coemansia sp. Benny D115]|nr:hypothetical protein GGI07_005200 [Coemansia sp. Benny D115]
MSSEAVAEKASALAGFPLAQRVASGYPALLSMHWDSSALPVGIFMTLHALRVAYEVRKGQQTQGYRPPLFQGLFTMLTFSFGGAILTSLALGRPQAWLESNVAVPVYSLAYILMTRMPGDLLFWALQSTAPVSDVFLALVDGLIRGYGVTAAGVDMVRKGMQGQPIADSLVAWVVVGTVLGSGGGIIDDVVQFSKAAWTVRTPQLLSRGPSLDVKVSFAATMGYILTTHAWSFAEHAPGFPLSGLLDTLLRMVPRVSDEEARLISGMLCAAVLGTSANSQARLFAAAERRRQELGRIKKTDAPVSDDSDADVEDDADEKDESE